MKLKCILIITALLLATCSLETVFAESGQDAVIIPEEGWSWTRGAYNTFTGQIDLTGCNAEELTVSVSTDLPYNKDTEQQSMPVFTSVNGKRIVMTKQSNSVHIVPKSAESSMTFSGSFKFPEKTHVDKITFVFSLTDPNGTEIKSIICRVEAAGNTKGNGTNPFYIPVSIHMITIILAAAAVMIWTAVFIKNRLAGKS